VPDPPPEPAERERWAHEHVDRFNTAVLSGDWSALVTTFHPDAVMEFVGPPVGPFTDRDVIAAAYRAAPPDDTMRIQSVDHGLIAFAWSRGGTGTMEIERADGLITRLLVGNDQGIPLYGQASRQVFSLITNIYGWWRWQNNRRRSHGTAVTPHWATHQQRLHYGPLALVAVAICHFVFRAIGAGFPVPSWYYLADSWIFVGSMLATYAMARGWVEFWLC